MFNLHHKVSERRIKEQDVIFLPELMMRWSYLYYIKIIKEINSKRLTPYVVKGADLVITPDTSIVHIASALNKANISVYPPKGGKYGVDHLVWAPKTKETKVIKTNKL